MKFTIYQDSRIGRRQSNQDRLAYCYSREALLMVVADGMGGHLHGEVAAQIAVQYIVQAFQREAQPTLADPSLFLSWTLTNAHHAILDYAFDKSLREAPRTTVVACLIQDGMGYWAHAGDSRLYLLRHGRVQCRSRDHSRVQLMVDQGLLDLEGAAHHPERNRIYSCLGGTHPPQIEYSRPTPLYHGDVLVLCTDGAWGPMQDDELAGALNTPDIMAAVPPLLDEAERRNGQSCDNLSLIALQWLDDPATLLPSAVSTQTMALDGFTTQLDAFGETRPPRGGTDLTDDEIERAIAEINAAIHKFSK
ncbi:MAG: serine/threonine-protein phosphatase [Rhodocyclaceae bacterium]|jgi:serine/threonine protein phosphatase PrpC|nr:serine/threonine-protein phosphatase [Rhodocyclaceae bacterium]